MLNTELLYNDLNKISDNEFNNIINCRVPIEEALGIEVQKGVVEYKKKINENCFQIKDKNNNDKEVFVKYITLIDFLKYLTGKYKNEDLTILPGDPIKYEQTKYHSYINDKNNYAYIDSLFYYISGLLKEEHQFIHGIECYDMFIC